MKPEIYTVSGGELGSGNASAMSEVVDNHAVDIDPYELTETVERARKRGAAASAGLGLGGEGAGASSNSGGGAGDVVAELWGGFLDDLLGSKKQSRSL
jgi:hypothetical protein